MDATIVKVNIAGEIFTTTVSTLQKAKYFSDGLALQSDLSDVVIDRCPRAFQYLLNCLRDRSYITAEKLQEFKPEIIYFGMDCLTVEATKLLPTVTTTENSLFKIVIWHGIAFLQPKEDLQLTLGQFVDLGISVSDYPGYYLEICSMDGFVHRLCGGLFK